LIHDARACRDNELDVKLEYLLEKLSDLKAVENNPDLKFLIFTEFTSTQSMLAHELAQRGGYICETINGSMDFETRVEALKRFKASAQILVSTDAAGESLNMQFAHIIINYDLPWNPMVLEQRIGRVDRIGQTFDVLAFNLMINNSIDARVYEVIETKLNQIMAELGIDKTADVLDSTLETESVNKLFMASLLDPKRFEGESKEWLADIRKKLQNFKSTEGTLPIANSKDIRADKVESVRFSPLPEWLHQMTRLWLQTKSIPYITSEIGLKTMFPGQNEKWYTFDTKTGLENPIPEPLTLQHERIQHILSEAVPHIATNPIPSVLVQDPNCPDGYFLLWSIKAFNTFECLEQVVPLYITNDGDVFQTYAQTFWTKFSTFDLVISVQASDVLDSVATFEQLKTKSEELLVPVFEKMSQNIESKATVAQKNKAKAFEFQMRQVEKIGIEQIRNHRIKKYRREYEVWTQDFASSARIIPELSCMLIMRVSHG